ncbi:MAG TPA: hypothetical protein VIG24_16295 [Acidimicrobiia bacterium]
MKPMLASDAKLDKVQFPVIAQPKIDGVRGLVIDGRLVGRSLKQHRNPYVTEKYSHAIFDGLDGELISGTDPTASDLCRRTTGDVSRMTGEPEVTFYVFDLIDDYTDGLPYNVRMSYLQHRLDDFESHWNVQMVPSKLICTLEELEALDLEHLEQGYEGTIIRNKQGLHKQGRSTVKEGGLLRIKRFVEEEARVLSLKEGNHNGNEAKKNELGRTERSSHKENMVPNGLVGGLVCHCLKTGTEILVSPGRMTHDDRKHYWENPGQIIGTVIKYKHFEIGRKDKPRFPTFQSFRAASDMEGA